MGKTEKYRKKINFDNMEDKGKSHHKPTKKKPADNGRLKINLPFEEAMKIAFTPKSKPSKK